MNECRYHGWCRIEYDTDFDVCYPCVGDWGETCVEYEPMPDVGALNKLAQEIDSMERIMFKNEVRVSDELLAFYARRIREALGVEDGS